jgi:hypothetical protein
MIIYNPISVDNDSVLSKPIITRRGDEFIDATLEKQLHDNSVSIWVEGSLIPFVMNVDWRTGGIDRDFCLVSSDELARRMKRRFVFFTPKYASHILKL